MPIRWSHAAALTTIVGSAFAAGCGSGVTVSDRQTAVRAHGQEVMPFDLKRTTHTFAKTAAGGVESVTTKSPGDRAQLPLIRQHLRKEQRLFSRGDFRDPMATHGMRMPGLDTLRTHSSQINITYRPLPEGAQLRYTTTDQTIRAALHDWFDAQVTDHGSDAHP
jgi:hypothetical protein